jgi:hypothetical protein
MIAAAEMIDGICVVKPLIELNTIYHAAMCECVAGMRLRTPLNSRDDYISLLELVGQNGNTNRLRWETKRQQEKAKV